MKPLPEQDHYEVLEIAPGASAEEVERAYQVACTAYAEDSLATYSLFGDEDVRELRRRVEAAYRVLSDAVSRRDYDRALRGDQPEPPEISLELDPRLEARRALEPRLEAAPAPPPLEGFDEDSAADDTPCDGARLRRARMRRGLDLEQIAAITKINPSYLRWIEEERFDDLPAAVYVRGFVAAVARCVGLDPAAAAAGYLQRFEAVRAARKRARR